MRKNFLVYVSNQKKFFVFAAIFLIIVACNSSYKKNTTEKSTISSDTTFMNVSETHLAEAAGADVFRANCVTCHSARYVEMQPDFSRKTWEKIVDKMVKSYGTPITDSTAKIIVDYLTTIKGENKIGTQ